MWSVFLQKGTPEPENSAPKVGQNQNKWANSLPNSDALTQETFPFLEDSWRFPCPCCSPWVALRAYLDDINNWVWFKAYVKLREIVN